MEANLREEIARDQRRADLPNEGVATPRAIGRRRLQLAFLVAVVAGGLIFATLVSARVIDLARTSWIDAGATRLALCGFSVFVIVYAFDKERILRRVVREREQLSALDGEVAGNLLTAGLVLDAVNALHACLELADLLPCIVDQGRALVGADCGVLFLEEERRPMQPVVDPNAMASVARPMVDVIAERGTVVGCGDGKVLDVGVPIAADGQLLAVLVLPGVAMTAVTDDMSVLLSRFGASAANALTNARRYEAAMFLLDVAH